MIATEAALKARADLTYIADRWAELEARLQPGGGNALAGKVSTSRTRPAPIDLHVSDLMAEIDWKIGLHYCHALMDETDDIRNMPADPVSRLRLVALRYGHFVAADDRTALQFCDDAAEYRSKVQNTLERPDPPVYLGPCPQTDCEGELYVRDGISKTTCRVCGVEQTVNEQRAWIGVQMEERLMTQTELGRALKILGHDIQAATVRKWVERKRLVETVDGLYRLVDAVALAESGRRVRV